MLETHHEEEMKAAISAYEEYYRTGNSFFEKKEFGGIQKTDAFNELLNNIKNIHTEYHNSEAIPRDGEEWKLWMYYKRIYNPRKTHLLTQCPFCLAEEEGKDPSDWCNTSLFEYQIDQRIENLLEIMKNEEMKGLISEFEEYLKTEECFSDKEIKNWSLSLTSNNHTYYVNETAKYTKYKSNIEKFHNEFHRDTIDFFGDVGKTLFYNKSDETTCCPFCILINQKKNMHFDYTEQDFYWWQKNGFALNAFNNYITRKDAEFKKAEEQRKEEERKRKEAEKIAAMPTYTLDDIYKEIKSNEIVAKKKFDGKEIKIRDKIYSVKDEYISFEGFYPDLYLERSVLEELRAGQYITFIATIKFSEWDLLGGYHFEKPRIISVGNATVDDIDFTDLAFDLIFGF